MNTNSDLRQQHTAKQQQQLRKLKEEGVAGS
jgi:hypothetical protein